ncbi:MAG TPA: 4'-phosphopantetheinyl transferase superfamily protein [Candidatus Kapabacteria bacterium]|nr:4'-phosphopantetheinyl transferase superfamily protein [Candidatus Kapabacteria bacterium]
MTGRVLTPPELTAGHVHVWSIPLAVSPKELMSLRHILQPDERERAARFLRDRDRAHFVAARGMLREVLGAYLGSNPANVRFCYGAYGKPELAPEHESDLRFNLSHSGELALCAVTTGCSVGVDLERIRPDIEFESIALRFFSAQEVHAFSLLSDDVRPRAFFNCWTGKEAYIKAIGEGLSMPLDQFDVVFTPGEPAAIHRGREYPEGTQRWELTRLDVGREYAAALVVEGKGYRITHLHACTESASRRWE